MKRSDFIRTFFRFSILAGIGALVALFLRNGQISMDNECDSDFQCKNCGKLNNCNLSDANKYKENGRR